jgi:hypothetical protein
MLTAQSNVRFAIRADCTLEVGRSRATSAWSRAFLMNLETDPRTQYCTKSPLRPRLSRNAIYD